MIIMRVASILVVAGLLEGCSASGVRGQSRKLAEMSRDIK